MTIETYLDRHFANAQIHSAPAGFAGEGNAHTFTIKDKDELHVLAVCRDFLESYNGSMWRYLAEHNVAEALRNVGAERLVVTPEGLRRNCTQSVTRPAARAPKPRPATDGRPSPLTRDDKRQFLACLARYANVSWAAEQVGKTRACLYAHRKRDPEFAAAWKEIAEKSTGRYNRVSMDRGYRVIDMRMGRANAAPRSASRGYTRQPSGRGPGRGNVFEERY